jgi:LysM repeat protein
MAEWATYVLLALALVVPILGALLLRLIADRISEIQGAIAVAVLVGIAITSVLILARSEVTNLGVGSLNLLRPATRPADSPLPSEPTAWVEPPVAFVPDEVAPIVVETATVTPSATASAVLTTTRTITGTRTARPTASTTRTARPTASTTRTAAATATLTPTLTATSAPTADPTEAVLATLEAIRATQQAAATPTPEPTATPEPEPTPVPEPEPEPPAQQVYVVQPGDTLRGIAEEFGVSVDALLNANGLTPEEGDQIRPGQELIIP